MLTKSDFMSFMACPARLWLERKRKDLVPTIDPGLAEIFAQGREVDDYARELFPDGVEVVGFNKTGWDSFQRAIAAGEKRLYQPSVVARERLACRADIVVWNERLKAWDIYEVKSSTRVKGDHHYDATFQRICFEWADLPVGRVFVVHLNRDYVRHGEIDPKELFTVVDVTRETKRLRGEVEKLIPQAEAVLSLGKDVTSELIRSCDPLSGCEWTGYLLSGVEPESRTEVLGDLSDDILKYLLESGTIDPEAVPDELLDRLGSVVLPSADDAGQVNVDARGLRRELSTLEYPLYYFDYETYAPAIPLYEGFRPYQRIPFQFSLDIEREAGGPLEHHDFLALTSDDPSADCVGKLREAVGPVGTFISWYIQFEQGVNQELADRLPEHADFLHDINDRMYDPMLVFRKGRLYDDSRLAGRASLKLVAPLLVGDMYSELEIKQGAVASASWPKLVGLRECPDDREALKAAMLRYCTVDTVGMVRIMERLRTAAEVRKSDNEK